MSVKIKYRFPFDFFKLTPKTTHKVWLKKLKFTYSVRFI